MDNIFQFVIQRTCFISIPSAGYYCHFANINTLNVIALVHDYLSVFVHNKTVHIHHLPDHDSLDRHLLLGSLCLIVYFIYMNFFFLLGLTVNANTVPQLMG